MSTIVTLIILLGLIALISVPIVLARRRKSPADARRHRGAAASLPWPDPRSPYDRIPTLLTHAERDFFTVLQGPCQLATSSSPRFVSQAWFRSSHGRAAINLIGGASRPSASTSYWSTRPPSRRAWSSSLTMLRMLAPRLPPNEQPAVYAEALAAADTITDEWARALPALAPALPADLLAEALAVARAIRDEWTRARVLQALAPQLARTLSTIATSATSSVSLWHTTLRILATRGRPVLLGDLTTLVPWLAALASPEELKEIAIAIRDVSCCWP
jgi:hypothetical protein